MPAAEAGKSEGESGAAQRIPRPPILYINCVFYLLFFCINLYTGLFVSGLPKPASN